MHSEKLQPKKKAQIKEDLNYMRTEMQKIIDNHLKGDDKRFSVMEYNYDQLNLLIDLLKWRKTRKDIEANLKNNENRIKMTYDQIVNEYNLINSLKNISRETRSDLTSLNADITLESDLRNTNY